MSIKHKRPRRTPPKPGDAWAAVIDALRQEGVRTPEEALDVLHDYRLQAQQCGRLHKLYEVEDPPIRLGAERLCPNCMRKLYRGYVPPYCPDCGKRMKTL